MSKREELKKSVKNRGMEFVTAFSSSFVTMLTSATPNPNAADIFIRTLMTLLMVIGIIYGISYWINESKKATTTKSTVIAAAIGAQRDLIEKEAIYPDASKSLKSLLTSVPESQQYLVNLCPLTLHMGGYIGGTVFDLSTYVRKALKAGARSFVLPISTYIDDNKVPPNWPYSMDPAIVMRDSSNDKITSINGITVKSFCEQLLISLGENADLMNEPIMLYIQEVPGKVPNKVSEEEKYATLMGKLATELEVLTREKRLITLGILGSAVGGVRESEILKQTPLKDLANKILILTNFDTKIGLKYPAKKQLHEYANFIYTAGSDTEVKVGKNSTTLHLSDVSGSKLHLTNLAKVAWFSTSIDVPGKNPDYNKISQALTTGIQSIPFTLFNDKTKEEKENTLAILKLWNGAAWRLKDDAARFTKPSPIIPARPSEAMNARVSPNLQGGQLVVK